MTRDEEKAALIVAGMGLYAEPKLLAAGPYAGAWAHLAQMITTVAVMVSTPDERLTHWCYRTRREAKAALDAWDGIGDPPGDWTVQKPGDRRRAA